MSSRRIEDMTPSLQKKFKLFKKGMDKAGIPFILTCTARFVREQFALWAQGREPLDYVNDLRQKAGMPFITEEQNVEVTWTLQSKHLVDLEDDRVDNDKSQAFDIAITPGGKPVWDLKVNVNKNEIPDYEEAARIGESVGLKAGARFKKPDYPHFEE